MVGGVRGKGRACQQESDGLEDAFWGSCAAAVAPCSCKLPVVLCTHVLLNSSYYLRLSESLFYFNPAPHAPAAFSL